MILDLALRDPAENLALEEAILLAYGADRVPPTLRIWRNPRCVVIGRSQSPEEEADLDACRRYGIPVFRRQSGGGAVYHHPGNLNFSLFLPLDGPWADVREAYRMVGGMLCEALRTRYGLEAEARDGSVFIEGLKVSGMAQYRYRGLLIHGTLLLWDDKIPMEELLRAFRPDYSPSRVPSRPNRTGSLGGLLEKEITPEDGVRLLISAFRPLGRFRREELSLREWAIAWSLVPRYRAEGWIAPRRPATSG